MELHAVCCYFNPCGYAARLRNYNQFRASWAASRVPLLTVECAFFDRPFELKPGPDVLQLRSQSILWQKERLLNIGLERVIAAGAKRVMWTDADIEFKEASIWPEKVLDALEHKEVVQCFSKLVLNYTDRQRNSSISAAQKILNGEKSGEK